MKMKFAVVLCAAAWAAGAVELFKADNGDALSSGSSWVGGIAPGADDVALWDGETAGSGNWTYGLGADAAWGGIRFTNAVSGLTVTNDGHTLTLGAGGLDLSGVTSSGYISHLHLPLALAAPQTWKGGAGATYLYGPVSGTGPLILVGTKGWYAFHEPVTAAEGVTVNCAGVYLRTNAAFAGPVTVLPGNQLWVNRSDASEWAQLFPGRIVTNNGLVWFGGQPGTVRGAVTLGVGDSLVSAPSESRNNGRVSIQVNDVAQNGGGITANWFDVTGGTFAQTQGTTFFEYAAAIGMGAGVAGAVERDVTVAGGTLDARRLLVGVGNSYEYPGVFAVAGGEVKADRGTTFQHVGVAIGAAKGDSLSVAASARPAGVLRVTSGTLDTMQISYGDFNYPRDSSRNVTNGFTRFELRGGEVNVGAGGIGPAPVWNRETVPGTAKSRCETLWSGGTLGAAASFDCRARVILSDADGGVTVRTADAGGTPRTVTLREALAGTGSLRKTGAGRLVLAAGCTYTGRTTVAEGTLQVGGFGATAVWRADDLPGAGGTTVNGWTCSSGEENWTFSSAVAQNIRATFTPPQVAAEPINGHKAVRFNGATDALALSALATPTTPASGSGEGRLSVAVVVRPQGAGQGTGSDVRDAAGIVGSQYAAQAGGLWALGVRQDGAAGAGFGPTNMPPPPWATAWGAAGGLSLGVPHVVIYTGEGVPHVELNVDGTRSRQTVSSTPASLSKTRIILGSNENGLGFNGDISEVRFYRGVYLSAEEQDRIGSELAATYGAAYESVVPPAPVGGTEGLVPPPVAGGTTAGTEEPVPPAVAVWNTENLSGAAGTVVDSWASTNGTWTFNSAIAKAIHGWATSPAIGAETLGGYKTVSFDGASNHLALTGSGPSTPASGATDLTVAVVLRPRGRGTGGQGDWRSAAGIIGQNYNPGAHWGLATSSSGLVGAGVSSVASQATAWSERPMFYDTEAHVAVLVWKGGESVSVNVDGVLNTVTNNPQSGGRVKTRIILGSNEAGSCFRGEIAEIRFWQNALTVAQQNALGLELARKYALSEEGYVSDAASLAQGPFASREVEIAEGAAFDARGGAYRIRAGQMFRGGGMASGGLIVGAGGVLEAGSDAALSVDALAVEAGGVLRWRCGADGTHAPTEVAGDVVLPAGTVCVEIDAAGGNPAPRGVLLRYGGTLTDNGAVWAVAGGRGATRVVHDAADKRLLVATPTGTFLSVR